MNQISRVDEVEGAKKVVSNCKSMIFRELVGQLYELFEVVVYKLHHQEYHLVRLIDKNVVQLG